MTERLDPASLLVALREAAIDYVVIGGLAVIAYGVQRFTKDVDICPSPQPANLARLAGLLTDLDAHQLGVGDFAEHEFPFDPRKPEDLAEGGNFRLVTRFGVLDVMQWIPGIEADHAYPVLHPATVTAWAFGGEFRVCSLEHLRVMKRAADRPQDRIDLEQLAIAQGEDPNMDA